MFPHLNPFYECSSDIGKQNRYRYKLGYDFCFTLQDVGHRKDMLFVAVKFKEKKYEPIPVDPAHTNQDGELCFPDHLPADKVFDLILFREFEEKNKDATRERPKFTEPQFKGFQQYL